MTTQPTPPGTPSPPASQPDASLADDPLLAPARDAMAAADADEVPLDERARRLGAAQSALAALLEGERPGGPLS